MGEQRGGIDGEPLWPRACHMLSLKLRHSAHSARGLTSVCRTELNGDHKLRVLDGKRRGKRL